MEYKCESHPGSPSQNMNVSLRWNISVSLIHRLSQYIECQSHVEYKCVSHPIQIACQNNECQSHVEYKRVWYVFQADTSCFQGRAHFKNYLPALRQASLIFFTRSSDDGMMLGLGLWLSRWLGLCWGVMMVWCDAGVGAVAV